MTPYSLTAVELLDRENITPENTPFQLTRPIITQVFTGGAVPFVSSSVDVYDVVSEFAKYGTDNRDALGACPDFLGFTVTTTGWAAPLDPITRETGMAPSGHPLRRRCALVVAATRRGIASRIMFEDDLSKIEDNDGSATGSLAEIIFSTGLSVFGDSFAEAMARHLIASLETEGGEA